MNFSFHKPNIANGIDQRKAASRTNYTDMCQFSALKFNQISFIAILISKYSTLEILIFIFWKINSMHSRNTKYNVTLKVCTNSKMYFHQKNFKDQILLSP